MGDSEEDMSQYSCLLEDEEEIDIEYEIECLKEEIKNLKVSLKNLREVVNRKS